MIPVFFSFIFSFILSCFVLSSLSSSLLSLHSWSLSLSPCDVVCVSVCCVLLCVVGVCCVWVWVFVCGCWLCTWSWWSVRCGTLKNPVCPHKTPPWVRSKRPRVHRHHAHMCFNMCAWCRYTWKRIERTHGGVLSGHTESSPVLLTKKSPRTVLTCPREVHQKERKNLAHFFLSLGGVCREQHVRDSSNHSLYLTKLFNSSSPEGNCGGNQLWDGSICLSHLLASSNMNGDGGREKTPYHRKGRWPSTTCHRFFASRCSFKHCLTCWVTSTCETVLETAARSKKKMTRCGRSTAPPPPPHAKKVKIMHYATQHTPHGPHSLILSCLVSSLFSFLLFSYIYPISSAILLKLTFANMSVGKARPCEQDTRMPINITAQENFITLLSVCFLLADVFACSLLVGCWLYVCCMFAVSLGWLVGCHSRTRRRTVSCVFTFTKHHAGQHTKKTTSTGESCERVQWQTWTQKKATHMFGKVDEQRP